MELERDEKMGSEDEQYKVENSGRVLYEHHTKNWGNLHGTLRLNLYLIRSRLM